MPSSSVLEVQVGTPTLVLSALGGLLVLFLGYSHWSQRKTTSSLPQLDGALPILGNFLELVKTGLKPYGFTDTVLGWQRTTAPGALPFVVKAPFWLVSFGGQMTFVNRPEYIEYIQKTNFDNYPKGDQVQRIFHDVLHRDGIFAADGAVWKKQRKLAANIFSANNFRTHVQSAVHKELKTYKSLLATIAKDDIEANLPDLFFRFTLASFANMAFGANLSCLSEDPADLQREVPFAKAFDSAQTRLFHRFLDGQWAWKEMLLPIGAEMRSNVRILQKTCYDIIDQRMAANAQQGGERTTVSSKTGKDLLQLFIDHGLSREELVPVCLNFLIAGRDTTAQALSWAFLMFHRNPAVYAKCREEARRVLGQRMMEYDDLKNMPYTHAAFYETLRLYPSVSRNSKRVQDDDIIRAPPGSKLPDVPVRRGTTVMWSDYVIARLPEVWGEDCEEFKPERFLQGSEQDGTLCVKTFSPYQFHAFNAGPRICLGQTLATYEGCAVIAAITSQYGVVFDEKALADDPPVGSNSLTFPIHNPYNVHLRAAEA